MTTNKVRAHATRKRERAMVVLLTMLLVAASAVVLSPSSRATPSVAAPSVATPGAADPSVPDLSAIASAQQALDRPAPGSDGMGNGGYDPAMPTDPEVLGAWLEELRGEGAQPARFATLLAQYWTAVGARNAGLDLQRWDPSRGLAANETNLEKTFDYYSRLGLEHAEFLWTGQGGLAGPSFAAGIMDLDMSRIAVGSSAPTLAEIDFFQQRVIGMSKHIFIDLIPQHEAYLAGGLPAIEEYRVAGLIDDSTLDAWRQVARGVQTGDRQEIVDGNLALLAREQLTVIADQWDEVAQADPPAGPLLTYLSTFAADPAIPGLIPPREYAPVILDGAATGSSGLRISTPFVAFNWADRQARWKYIVDCMSPAYNTFRFDNEPAWRAELSKPARVRIAEQRALSRLPQMLESMVSLTGSA